LVLSINRAADWDREQLLEWIGREAGEAERGPICELIEGMTAQAIFEFFNWTAVEVTRRLHHESAQEWVEAHLRIYQGTIVMYHSTTQRISFITCHLGGGQTTATNAVYRPVEKPRSLRTLNKSNPRLLAGSLALAALGTEISLLPFSVVASPHPLQSM
jgi:hypothetical protein